MSLGFLGVSRLETQDDGINQEVKMAYIPKKYEKYDLLPACKRRGGGGLKARKKRKLIEIIKQQ